MLSTKTNPDTKFRPANFFAVLQQRHQYITHSMIENERDSVMVHNY